MNIEKSETKKSLRLHCKLSSERYKQELEKTKQKPALSNRELKHKQKLEEVEKFEETAALSKTITDLRTAHKIRVTESRWPARLEIISKSCILMLSKEKESKLKKITDSEKTLLEELKQI